MTLVKTRIYSPVVYVKTVDRTPLSKDTVVYRYTYIGLTTCYRIIILSHRHSFFSYGCIHTLVTLQCIKLANIYLAQLGLTYGMSQYRCCQPVHPYTYPHWSKICRCRNLCSKIRPDNYLSFYIDLIMLFALDIVDHSFNVCYNRVAYLYYHIQ